MFLAAIQIALMLAGMAALSTGTFWTGPLRRNSGARARLAGAILALSMPIVFVGARAVQPFLELQGYQTETGVPGWAATAITIEGTLMFALLARGVASGQSRGRPSRRVVASR